MSPLAAPRAPRHHSPSPAGAVVWLASIILVLISMISQCGSDPETSGSVLPPATQSPAPTSESSHPVVPETTDGEPSAEPTAVNIAAPPPPEPEPEPFQETEPLQEPEPAQNYRDSGVGGGSVYYKNCAAARAAGAAPIHTGEPGYAPHLDRDGDSIACES